MSNSRSAVHLARLADSSLLSGLSFARDLRRKSPEADVRLKERKFSCSTTPIARPIESTPCRINICPPAFAEGQDHVGLPGSFWQSYYGHALLRKHRL